MSLLSRIAELITPIGADIHALRDRLAAYSASTATQSVFGTGNVYVTGSAVAIPQGKIKAGTIYRGRISVRNSANNSGSPTFYIRVGTAGSTADTSRATVTFDAGGNTADEGLFEFECIFRSAGASAVIEVKGTLIHRTTTGLNSTAIYTQILNTGGSFDVTGAGLKIGISVNPGTTYQWYFDIVTAELLNLAP